VRASICAACIAWLMSGTVFAQDAQETAETEHAKELFNEGDYVAAAALWESELARLGETQGWKLLYNLGLSYEKLSDATRAIERYEAFIRRVPAQSDAADPAVEERRVDAVERVDRLKKTHGALRVEATRRSVMVRVNDAQPRRAGFTVYLVPGEHHVEIDSGTARARRTTVRLAAGQRETILIHDDTAPRRPKPPKVVPDKTDEPSFPIGWVIAGAAVTVASVAAPVALHFVTLDERDEAQALGTAHADYPDALDDFRTMRTLYYASYALPATFGAATATLAIVYAVSGSAPDVALLPLERGAAVWARASF